MARGVFSTSNHFSRTDSTITVEPITMACWVNTTDWSTQQCAMSIQKVAGDGFFHLRVRNGPKVSAIKDSDAGVADYSGSMSNNTWYHIAAVFANTTSRTVYCNGVAGTPNSTSSGAVTAAEQAVGARNIGSWGMPFLGPITEAAIWNVALTDAEITSLACGVSPLSISPASLVRYWPLTAAGGNELDYSGNGATLSETGTAGTATHPTVMPNCTFEDNVGAVLTDGIAGQHYLLASFGENLEN